MSRHRRRRSSPRISMAIVSESELQKSDGSRYEMPLTVSSGHYLTQNWLGAVNHICSAATVAASSFSMTLTDPCHLLQDIPETTYKHYIALCKRQRRDSDLQAPALYQFDYVEPGLLPETQRPVPSTTSTNIDASPGLIQSRAYRLGDYVDTDAVSCYAPKHSPRRWPYSHAC